MESFELQSTQVYPDYDKSISGVVFIGKTLKFHNNAQCSGVEAPTICRPLKHRTSEMSC
jgi:hypothetical protein